jgi:hypothetical protein
MELSPEKNDGKFASCATRNDAVSCHFFPGDTPSSNKTKQNQKKNTNKTKQNQKKKPKQNKTKKKKKKNKEKTNKQTKKKNQTNKQTNKKIHSLIILHRI